VPVTSEVTGTYWLLWTASTAAGWTLCAALMAVVRDLTFAPPSSGATMGAVTGAALQWLLERGSQDQPVRGDPVQP
jgi:hypothetical protein